MSSLLFLPHPGISPAQSAEGCAWRGSDVKGRSLWSVLAERGVLEGAEKGETGENKRVFGERSLREARSCERTKNKSKQRELVCRTERTKAS